MARLSNLGSIISSSGFVDSLYVMVSVLKCVITCEFGKGLVWGLRLWYQFWSCVTSSVTKTDHFWLQGVPSGGFVEFHLLYVGGCIRCLAIVLKHFSYLFEYFVSRKWGVELFECGRAYYWWWEIQVHNLEGIYEMLKDGVWECVLWKF